MKRLLKVLKMIGIVLIAVIALIIILVVFLSNMPSPPKNYWEKVETDGKIEKKYLAEGSYETSCYEETALQWFEKYEIYYPTAMLEDDRQYPVIVVCNGTGMKASKSKYILEHYASWGFIVIGTEETYSWNAFGAEMCIRHLETLNEKETYNDADNIFYRKIDFENVGIIGHSQGGVGVINAITNTEHRGIYKTAVSLSPTNQELAETLEWHYDASKIDIPILIFSGAGGGDDWVITGEQLEALCQSILSDKVAVRRKDTSHGNTAYSEDGYVIAWFMWQIQGDEEAAKAFTGEAPEILTNELYQDQMIDLR